MTDTVTGDSFLGLLDTGRDSSNTVDLVECDAQRFPIAFIDNIVIITGDTSPALEPATMAILSLGLVGLRLARRK